MPTARSITPAVLGPRAVDDRVLTEVVRVPGAVEQPAEVTRTIAVVDSVATTGSGDRPENTIPAVSKEKVGSVNLRRAITHNHSTTSTAAIPIPGSTDQTSASASAWNTDATRLSTANATHAVHGQPDHMPIRWIPAIVATPGPKNSASRSVPMISTRAPAMVTRASAVGHRAAGRPGRAGHVRHGPILRNTGGRGVDRTADRVRIRAEACRSCGSVVPA